MRPIPSIATLTRARLSPRAVIYGGALVWLWVTTTMPTDLALWLSVAWVAAPALVGLAVSREMRRRWWRVPVIWFLFLNSYGATAPLIVGIGYAWAISQAWIAAHPVQTEQDSRDEDNDAPRTEANRKRRRLARSGNPAKAAAAREAA